MKKQCVLFSLLLTFGIEALSQNWGPWITVYRNGDHVVEVSYKAGDCRKARQGYYRTRNSHVLKNCWISFKMSFIGCEGAAQTFISIYLDKTGIVQNGGNWYMGSEITNPYFDLSMNGSCAAKKNSNNEGERGNEGTKELIFPAKERTEYRNLKSSLNSSIDALEQNAFKSDFRNRYRDLTQTPDDELSKEEYLRRISGLQSLKAAIEKEKDTQNKLKQKNKSLEQQIRTEINSIPAPDAKAKLNAEFSAILASEKDEEAKNTELESFLYKVQSESAAIKANFRKAEEDKQAREEEIKNIRSQNNEIKKEQAQIVATYGAAATSLLSISGRSGKGSNYEGGSYKFSFKFGLIGLNQPVGYVDHMSGSRLNKISGQLQNIDEYYFENEAYPMPGIFLSAELHPWFSNFGSLGFTGSAAFTHWPEKHSDITYGGLNSAGNYRNRTVNIEYGVEFTAGIKAVKLLGRAHFHNLTIESGDLTSATFESASEKTEISTVHYTHQKWKSLWAAAGIRIGDYTKSNWYIDLAYTAYIPERINNKKTVFEKTDLMPGAQLTAPFGVYAQFSQQNGWAVKFNYIKKYILLNEKDNNLEYYDKAMFSIAICKSLEWFGKPYKGTKN